MELIGPTPDILPAQVQRESGVYQAGKTGMRSQHALPPLRSKFPSPELSRLLPQTASILAQITHTLFFLPLYLLQ